MEQNIYPVDVISVCSTDGKIRPLRVRLETDRHELIRIDIDDVLSVKPIQYVGIEAQIFLCRGSVQGMSRMFELRYTIRTHSWSLLRRVY